MDARIHICILIFCVIRRLWRRFLICEADQEQRMACYTAPMAMVLDLRSRSRTEHVVLYGAYGDGS